MRAACLAHLVALHLITLKSRLYVPGGGGARVSYKSSKQNEKTSHAADSDDVADRLVSPSTGNWSHRIPPELPVAKGANTRERLSLIIHVYIFEGLESARVAISCISRH